MTSPGRCMFIGMRCFHAVKVLRSCLNPSPRLKIPAGPKCMHSAATLLGELRDLDSNPFYDKYKEKLENIHGPSSSTSPSRSPSSSTSPSRSPSSSTSPSRSPSSSTSPSRSPSSSTSPSRSPSSSTSPGRSPTSSTSPGRAKTGVAKEEKAQSNIAHSRHPAASFSYTKPPTLDSVMHLGMIYNKSSEEIAKIWLEYHKTKDCISAVIPAEAYVQLHTKALHCPFFLYPIPRDEGYEFFYSQFSGHCCFFTSLINYQMYLENAPVCLTLTHYTDLQDSKGIVLMAGEVDTKCLTTLEAQFLANQLQLYYASKDQERYSLVRQFNHSPQDFDYSTIIAQLQNSGIQLQKERKQ